jgi:hypothetical protein
MLKAAFGKFDYTPPPARLGRLGINIHTAQGARWPLHLRAALFDDGSQRAAVVALDQGFMSAGVVAMLRAALQQSAGVAPSCCMVSATHTHNGPALMPWRTDDEGFALAASIAGRLSELGVQMAARLAPARLMVAQTEAPGWSWSRRTLYRDAVGRAWTGTLGERSGADFVGLEGPDESALRGVLALHDNGSVMGGLINFWCHPTTMYDEMVWSADFPGPLLDRLEEHYGGDFVYLSGPCGDLVPNSNGPAQGTTDTGPEYCRRMGQALAEKSIAAFQTAQPVKGDTVRGGAEVLSIAQRMATTAQVEIARDYLEHHRGQTLEPSLVQQLYGWPFHFRDPAAAMDEWLATEVIGMWEWQKRVGDPVLHEPVEVQAIVIGDLAFASVPCELFSEWGREIVNRSPQRHTFAVELANGMCGYVPLPESFEHGGYECCLGYQSRLEPQAGRLMVEAALDLLNRLAQKAEE